MWEVDDVVESVEVFFGEIGAVREFGGGEVFVLEDIFVEVDVKLVPVVLVTNHEEWCFDEWEPVLGKDAFVAIEAIFDTAIVRNCTVGG